MTDPYGDPRQRYTEPWWKRGACQARDDEGGYIYDPNWWHPEGDSRTRSATRAKAVKVCEVCPVAQSCFTAALNREPDAGTNPDDFGERSGVWGGVDFEWCRQRSKVTGRKWQTEARRARRAVELSMGEAARRKAAREAWVDMQAARNG